MSSVVRKYLLILLYVVLSGNIISAKPILTKSKYLIATLSAGASGTVSVGNNSYPLVYYPERDSESASETDYWMINEEENGLFSFRNASSLKYIRHNVASTSERTALVLTDALATDKSTLFSLELKKSGNLSFYIIRSTVNSNKVWDKRASQYDSFYPVGVYNGTGTDNQCFIFYDWDGNPVIDDSADKPLLYGIGKTLGAFANYADRLQFNSKTPVVDASKKEFYITIPETQIDGNVTQTVNFKLKNGSHTLFIDNKQVTDNADFNFGFVSASDKHSIEIRNGSTAIASGNIYFTCLPLVQIYTESNISSVYNLSKLSVTEPETTDSAEVVYMKIKIRGATAAYMPKKSFAVKLKEPDGETAMDRSFFGLRNDNNWILDAMYIDPSRMRNRVSTDLWNDFAVKPYFYESEPELINGTRGRFVEVFINDAYGGLYCMTEKIDRKQLKLKKFETSDNPQGITQRGGLYKGKTWDSGTFGGNSSMPTSFNNNSETWSGFEVKYPDLGDGEPIDWKPLVDAITISSHRTSNDNFKSKVADYFDLPVFMDYYLFIELMLASDNHGKNTYISVYNQKKSPMITISPWDCDGTWGRRWDGSSGITGANQNFDNFIATYEHAQNNLFLRLKSLNYNDYNNRLKNRYRELRGNYFSFENLLKRFERYYEQFEKSGAATREQNKWNNFADERNFLSTWIQKRLNYLDYQYLGSPYQSIDKVATQNIALSPNPVKDILTISNSTKGDRIMLVSNLGSVVVSLRSAGDETKIDMTHYAKGVYLLAVGNKTAKIVKM